MYPLWVLFGNSDAEVSSTTMTATASVLTVDSVRVAWATYPAVTDTIVIQRKLEGGAYATIASGVDPTTSPYTDDNSGAGLATGTYQYKVLAYDAGLNLLQSAETSTVDVTGLAVPAQPTGLSITITGGAGTAITLNWTDNATDETAYQVWQSINGAAFLAIESLAANSTSHAISGLTVGTSYQYYITASNGAGTSAASNTVTFVAGTPNDPSDFQVTVVTHESLTFTWTNNGGPVTNFKVWKDGQIFATVGVVTTYEASLDEGTEGTWWVTAFNQSAIQDSGASNTVETATELAPPTGFSATQIGGTGSSGFVRFSWTDNSSKEAEYVLQKDSVDFRTLPPNTTQTDVANDDADGTFRLQARHATLPDSEYSSSVTGPPWPS